VIKIKPVRGSPEREESQASVVRSVGRLSFRAATSTISGLQNINSVVYPEYLVLVLQNVMLLRNKLGDCMVVVLQNVMMSRKNRGLQS